MKKYLLLVALIYSSILFAQNPPTTTLWDYQSEGFEGTFPPTNWQVAHFGAATTDWEKSSTVGGFQNSSSSAFFDNIAATGFVHVLRTPSFDLTTAINPTVTFDVAYARYDDNNSDRLRLYFTTNTNGTSGWSVVQTFQNNDLATAPNQTTYFTPDEASDWETFTIDLTAFAGQSYVRFAFESNPDTSGPNVIYIDNVNFFDASPLAVEDEISFDFSIYPNPSNGIVNINTKLDNIEKENIQISNLIGQRFENFNIDKKGMNSYELDLQDFNSGMYFVTLTSDKKTITKKLYLK